MRPPRRQPRNRPQPASCYHCLPQISALGPDSQIAQGHPGMGLLQQLSPQQTEVHRPLPANHNKPASLRLQGPQHRRAQSQASLCPRPAVASQQCHRQGTRNLATDLRFTDSKRAVPQTRTQLPLLPHPCLHLLPLIIP